MKLRLFHCCPQHLQKPGLQAASPDHSGTHKRDENMTDPQQDVKVITQSVQESEDKSAKLSHLWEPEMRADFLKYSCEITLDPDTANRFLLLSEEDRAATFMGWKQSYPDHPDRFTSCSQVLSTQSLSGRCYWEVEWSGAALNLAIAYKTISRTGDLNECGFGRNDQSWSLECDRSSSAFWHDNLKTPISGPHSSRLGVYLDHGAGILSFYSVAGTMTLLHRVQTTFTQPVHAGLELFLSSGDTAEFCDLGLPDEMWHV